jgi:SAM-dependent methyltransferase
MIDFESAIERRTNLLKQFTSNKSSALDLGCGTGIDSISLTKLGIEVDAVDQSEGMVERAKLNAKYFDSKINFSISGIKEYNPGERKYDLILSLGNSLANCSENELAEIIIRVSKFLYSSGSIVIQVLNFNLLPNEGIFPVNRMESDKLLVNRFYDIENEKINFIIEYADKISNEKGSIKTEIFPHKKDTFMKLFDSDNFDIQLFGGLNKTEFKTTESKDLIILATKKY